jgi:hypothetical protein
LLAEKETSHTKKKNAEAEIEEHPAVEPGQAAVKQLNTWNTRQ